MKTIEPIENGELGVSRYIISLNLCKKVLIFDCFFAVTLIVKSCNQQFEDQEIRCELNWTIRKLKQQLAEVYPTKPVSVPLNRYSKLSCLFVYVEVHIRILRKWECMMQFRITFRFVRCHECLRKSTYLQWSLNQTCFLNSLLEQSV